MNPNIKIRKLCNSLRLGEGAGARGVIAALAKSLAITFFVVLASASIARIVLGFEYAFRGIAIDTLLLSAPVGCIGIVTRSLKKTAASAVLIVFVFSFSQAVGYSTLGVPLRISDMSALPTLLLVLPLWQKALASILLFAVLCLCSWIVYSSWRRSMILLLGLALLGTALRPDSWGSALASNFELKVGKEAGNRPALMGGVAFLLAENKVGESVPRSEIKRIVADTSWALKYSGKKRNIHFVLLETFWDPSRLSHFHFSRDPWDSRFRELVNSSKGSAALTPHFGHLTANAEFESLCGLPAPEGNAVFVDGLRAPMPCLPRVLDALGYFTQASHGNSANSWSRDKAYDFLGFSTFNAQRSFEVDDTDELFLTDSSFYRQNLESLGGAYKSGPLFNYLVSLSSHWPYHRDRARRPDVISVYPKDSQLSDYANGLYYSSKAFSDWLEEIRRRDPESLIVAYGDHSPVMPPRQQEYISSGFNMNDHARLSGEQLLLLSGTPLIVIDGSRGVVPVGKIPVSEIPNLILRLAFGPGIDLPQTAVLRNGGGGKFLYRKYLDRLLVGRNGEWQVCGMGEAGIANVPDCDLAERKLADATLLRVEMISSGLNFSEFLGLPAQLAKDETPISLPSRGCGIDVASFGPKNIKSGEGFNVQKKTGKSAFWFNLKRRFGRPSIRVGAQIEKLEMNGLFAAAAFENPGFVNSPGVHDVLVVCEGMPDVKIGSVRVAATNDLKLNSVNHGRITRSISFVKVAGAALEAFSISGAADVGSCDSRDWRGLIKINYDVHGDYPVQFSVRDEDSQPFKLWSAGRGRGEAVTGEWGRDGMQLRVETGGRRVDYRLHFESCH